MCESCASSLMTRSLLYANTHHSQSKWRPLHKPQWTTVQQQVTKLSVCLFVCQLLEVPTCYIILDNVWVTMGSHNKISRSYGMRPPL